MESGAGEGGWESPWYVAYHNSQRKTTVTVDDIDHANKCNYDMLTNPITTDHFHSRVLALLAAFDTNSDEIYPEVPTLSYLDSNITPGEVAPQVLAYTSTWIDICSPDPLISSISQQVLKLEIAYAAFCGVENVVIAGPNPYHGSNRANGVPVFARAIQEALSLASHMHLSVSFPTLQCPSADAEYEIGHLSEHAREEFRGSSSSTATQGTGKPPKGSCDGFDAFGTWDSWNLIRSVCNYSSRLSVVICLPPADTLNQFDKAIVTRVHCRWYSEPIRAISFQPNSFVKANKQGAPALSFPVQTLISRLIRVKFGPWFILHDVESLPAPENVSVDEDGILKVRGFKDKTFRFVKSPTPAEAASTSSKSTESPKWPFLHLEYLRYLQQRQPPRTVIETYGAGYQDYLQVPLQPLTHNLESMTYEVFEKDPVKYDLYEEAIRKALRDWKEKKIPSSGFDGRIVVAVAGAGRGPLVSRALKASKAENIPIEMWAVEKNPNAFVFLQRCNKNVWNSSVSLEKGDMRAWKGPWRKRSLSNGIKPREAELTMTSGSEDRVHYPVDILISELLGSFADNELSPECLDGILHLLSPTGISIPRSYTAFMTPIAAPKLHADILSRSSWDPTAPETPSVVLLHAIDYLSSTETSTSKPTSPPQGTVVNSPVTPKVLETWSFKHRPLAQKQSFPISNTHNSRFAHLKFEITHRATCHGLAGYFESVLYPGVELSIHPNTMDTKSNSMISWFPIFFPLKAPVYIPDASDLTLSLWRKTDDRKVWYEWLVETWSKDPRSDDNYYRLGFSDVHSSIKNGCLM